jgi:para-nitrobenzyl esterase
LTVRDLQAETTAGWVRGSESRGIVAFKGVPYARAPEGRLRFQPPHSPEPWRGVREATKSGAVPIQPAMPLFRFLNAGAARQSEDCLHLNVWTPGIDGAKRPVFLWIHGGGFLIGAGSTPVYDGNYLARTGDMVVVTINYRLGALGYVHLDGLGKPGFENSSNLGTRDQIAALEWVRDNIERFGGNPENVTVCGQSAGAMSVGALLGAASARGLFCRGILQSGAGRNVIGREMADRAAELFVRTLGKPRCTPQTLGEIPVAQILRAQSVVNRELMNPRDLMVMAPCLDGELITELPTDAVENGSVAHIDMMIGTTLDEWKLFAPIDSPLARSGESGLISRFADLLPELTSNSPPPEEAARLYREAVRKRGGRTTPFEVWSAFQSMRVFHRPALELADCHERAGGSVHSYLFSWKPAAFSQTLGACHAMELPFVFGLTSHPLTRAFTSFAGSARRLSGRMQDAWIAFARRGEPGHLGLPEWDAYDSSARATMVFDRECTLADNPLDAERRLLDAWD